MCHNLKAGIGFLSVRRLERRVTRKGKRPLNNSGRRYFPYIFVGWEAGFIPSERGENHELWTGRSVRYPSAPGRSGQGLRIDRNRHTAYDPGLGTGHHRRVNHLQFQNFIAPRARRNSPDPDPLDDRPPACGGEDGFSFSINPLPSKVRDIPGKWDRRRGGRGLFNTVLIHPASRRVPPSSIIFIILKKGTTARGLDE